VSITAQTIDVYGSHSYGIYAYGHGDVDVSAQSIVTGHTQVGGYSEPSGGVVAISDDGNATVDVGSVSAAGFGVVAIGGYYTFGDVAITAGDIEASGDFGFGVFGVNRGYGNLYVDVGTVETNGF